MKILVVAATPSELNAIKTGIKSAWIKSNMNIDYLCSWIWCYETISILEQYLTLHSEPTFIWNIWICWYWNPNNEKVTDPIQVATVMNVHSEKELIIPIFTQIAQLKNCFSSENIINKKPVFSKKVWTFNDEMFFDMECRWIEFVASKHKLPRLVLKFPFDFIWVGQHLSYKESAHETYELLSALPYKIYLKKILDWINKQEKKTKFTEN